VKSSTYEARQYREKLQADTGGLLQAAGKQASKHKHQASIQHPASSQTPIMSEACEHKILTHLASSVDAIISDSYEWSLLHGLDHNEVVGAMKSLMVDDYVQSSDMVSTFFVLSSEAEGIVLHGSQEMMVMSTLLTSGGGGGGGEEEAEVGESGQCKRGLTLAELQEKLGSEVCKIGMGNCLKNKWAKKDADRIVPLKNNIDEIVDEVKVALQILVDNQGKTDALDDKVCFPFVWSV
jgi:phenylalanyl-tRNA synthetase alpha chain